MRRFIVNTLILHYFLCLVEVSRFVFEDLRVDAAQRSIVLDNEHGVSLESLVAHLGFEALALLAAVGYLLRAILYSYLCDHIVDQ